MTVEAITATLDRHGLKAPEGDPRTEAEIKFDALFPPPTPADFKFNLAPHSETVDDLAAFNTDAREALVAMRMEPATGDWLCRHRPGSEAKWWGQADQLARDLYKTEQAEELEDQIRRRWHQTLCPVGRPGRSPGRAWTRGVPGEVCASHSAAVIRFLALNEARLTRRSTG